MSEATQQKRRDKRRAEFLAGQILSEGRDLVEVETILVDLPKIMARVRRIIGQVKVERANPMRTLTGRVKRETAKAILFVCEELGEVWLPKSQVQVYERAMGPADQVTVPEWLFAAKEKEMKDELQKC